MSTQKFFVLPHPQKGDNKPNGILRSKDKKDLGIAYNQIAPDGRRYISVSLDGHWIISDEEMKLLRKLMKESHE